MRGANPYHLRPPAWLMDNVRRGAELLGGAGGRAPEFTFATLYRLRRWRNREVKKLYSGRRMMSCRNNLAKLINR